MDGRNPKGPAFTSRAQDRATLCIATRKAAECRSGGTQQRLRHISKRSVKANSVTLASLSQGCSSPAVLSDRTSLEFRERWLSQTSAWMEIHVDALAKLYPRSGSELEFRSPTRRAACRDWEEHQKKKSSSSRADSIADGFDASRRPAVRCTAWGPAWAAAVLERISSARRKQGC